MKNFTKIICLLLCATTLGLVAVGCKNSSGSTSTNTSTSSTKLGGSITFWMQKYGNDPSAQTKFLNKITKDFKAQTGVTVNYSILDWSTALTKYTLASTGGAAPDVAETFFAYSQVKMGNNKYGPMQIDDVVKEVGFDKFYDFAKPECFVNGHWYALPWRGDTRAAVYNTKDFADAGIKSFPKTYAELIAVAAKLVKKDSSGTITKSAYVFSGNNQRFDQTWWSVLAGHGSKLMNDDYSKFTIFSDSKAKDSLQFMQDSVFKYAFMPKNVIDPTYDSGKLYMAGKVSIILGAGPGTLLDIHAQAPQLESVTKSAVMPSLTGSDSDISSIAFAAPVCVYQTTKNPIAAKAWLKYFISKEVQLDACKSMQLVDTRKDVMNDNYFSSNDWFKNFTQQTSQAVPGDMPLPTWSQIDAFPSGPINTMCMKIMQGQDVQKSMDACKAAIEKILPGSTN